jgi:hypothetical protein
MNSLSLLNSEIELMDKIISLLKEKKDENHIDIFENKKTQCELMRDNLQTLIENEQMTMKQYLMQIMKVEKNQSKNN